MSAKTYPERPASKTRPPCGCDEDHRECWPEFDRLCYFYGQMLGVKDFQTEQAYVRNKLRFHHRCLHGFGVICGLNLSAERPEEDCGAREGSGAKVVEGREEERDCDGGRGQRVEEVDDCEEDRVPRPGGPVFPNRLWLSPGAAIDCRGNELVLRRPIQIDLWQELSADDRQRIRAAAMPAAPSPSSQKDQPQPPQGTPAPPRPRLPRIYVSICHHECPFDRTRPVLTDGCGVREECAYNQVREGIRVRVRLEPAGRPCGERLEHEPGCHPCCECCEETCVLLACIECYERGKPLASRHIHNDVRRRIGPYPVTTVTAVSWKHGQSITWEAAKQVLGLEGPDLRMETKTWCGMKHEFKESKLVVRFSRPVKVKQVEAPGVVELWRVKTPSNHGEVSHVDTIVKALDGSSRAGYASRFQLYVNSKCLECAHGERFTVIVKGSFILDDCGRPVDGTHVGGAIPTEQELEEACDRCSPAYRHLRGPWFTSHVSSGGEFESWFYVTHEEENDEEVWDVDTRGPTCKWKRREQQGTGKAKARP